MVQIQRLALPDFFEGLPEEYKAPDFEETKKAVIDRANAISENRYFTLNTTPIEGGWCHVKCKATGYQGIMDPIGRVSLWNSLCWEAGSNCLLENYEMSTETFEKLKIMSKNTKETGYSGNPKCPYLELEISKEKWRK